MKDQISKSTFIFSLIIVVLITFIITRELSVRQSSGNSGASGAVTVLAPGNDASAPVLAKAKTLTGKDGNEADPYEKEQVKNTIIKEAKNLQKCYNAWLETRPSSPKANVKIDWTIMPDGKVLNPQVVESGAVGMNTCLLEKVSAMEFPPPPEGRSFYVAHKFGFNTEENLEKIRKEQEAMEKKLSPIKN